MAFSYTTTLKANVSPRISAGTFTNAGTDTGGTINTGLKAISYAAASFNSHVDSGNPKVTWSGAVLTITTNENSDGYWFAIGRV